MSVKNVHAFWTKVREDRALNQKLVSAQEEERQKSVAAVVKLAAEAGFVFSPQDFEVAVKEDLASRYSSGELSEEALESVAGGSTVWGTCAHCGTDDCLVLKPINPINPINPLNPISPKPIIPLDPTKLR